MISTTIAHAYASGKFDNCFLSVKLMNDANSLLTKLTVVRVLWINVIHDSGPVNRAALFVPLAVVAKAK